MVQMVNSGVRDEPPSQLPEVGLAGGLLAGTPGAGLRHMGAHPAALQRWAPPHPSRRFQVKKMVILCAFRLRSILSECCLKGLGHQLEFKYLDKNEHCCSSLLWWKSKLLPYPRDSRRKKVGCLVRSKLDYLETVHAASVMMDSRLWRIPGRLPFFQTGHRIHLVRLKNTQTGFCTPAHCSFSNFIDYTLQTQFDL